MKEEIIGACRVDPRLTKWLKQSTVLPTFLSRVPYRSQRPQVFLDKLQRKLYRSIKPSDFLLIRGLSTWLRSSMLGLHPLFMEETIATNFISMEASFRLVLRRLREQGKKDPTARDAADFVGTVFNEPPLQAYFQEYYESRIKAFHPESRFGVFPHAPVMADDFYDLHWSLMEIYVYLLTGYVDPQYSTRQR